MARRGRKRANGLRFRCGQLKRPRNAGRLASPTPERLARRLEASGRADVHDAWPLDVLRARDVISDAQAHAGLRYACLHWRAYGPPPSVGGHWRRIGLGFAAFETDIARDDEKSRRMFLLADQALSDAGEEARRAVLRAAAYLETPSSIPPLLRGLEALGRHFAGDCRRGKSPRHSRRGGAERERLTLEAQ